MNDFFKLSFINEFATNICFGNNISLETNQKVLSFFRFLKNKKLPEITGLVPTYSSLGVYWANSADIDFEKQINKLYNEFIESDFQETSIPGKVFEFKVDYSGSDLDFIARNCHLSIDEVIEIHTLPVYRVAMIGFLPGFPYLIGLDERLAVPRKLTPALKVRKGSVAIGGNQTGIYPTESPGGWHILGYIEDELFFPDLKQKSLLSPGDLVKFVPA